MKEALAVPNEQLRHVIGAEFAIDVVQLDFVPIGESSWLYKAADVNGQLLAVKLQGDVNPALDETRRRLTEQAYPYISQSHLTKDGKLQAPIGNLHISVEDYIEHDTVNAHDALPEPSYLATLGKALRELHRMPVFPQDRNGPLVVESFQSAFLSPARQTLNSFATWSVDKPKAQALRDTLANKASVIDALFARSTELGAQFATKRPDLVLTHGDVHFGNTLESNDGRFYLIDWDSTMIAGIGHDLMYFSDSQLSDISVGYDGDLLADQPNVQYYRNHLMVRFIWFYLNKAMQTTAEEGLQAVSNTVAEVLDNSDYLLRALGMNTSH